MNLNEAIAHFARIVEEVLPQGAMVAFLFSNQSGSVQPAQSGSTDINDWKSKWIYLGGGLSFGILNCGSGSPRDEGFDYRLTTAFTVDFLKNRIRKEPEINNLALMDYVCCFCFIFYY